MHTQYTAGSLRAIICIGGGQPLWFYSFFKVQRLLSAFWFNTALQLLHMQAENPNQNKKKLKLSSQTIAACEVWRQGEVRGARELVGAQGKKLLRSFSPHYPRLHLLSINPDTRGKKSSSADSKEEVEDVSVVHKHTQSERRDRRQRVLALWHNSTSFSRFLNSHITIVM